MSKTETKPLLRASEVNDVRYLQKFLTNSFSTARITVSEPISKSGVWLLDLFLADYHLAVAWKKEKGFGLVSSDTHGYGEGADEVYKTLDDVLPRIVKLVSERKSTSPPEAVRLKELRELRGLSQEELAQRLGSKQTAISRVEARSDFLVSTMQKYAEAMGGSLVVKMVFPDGEKELKLEDLK